MSVSPDVVRSSSVSPEASRAKAAQTLQLTDKIISGVAFFCLSGATFKNFDAHTWKSVSERVEKPLTLPTESQVYAAMKIEKLAQETLSPFRIDKSFQDDMDNPRWILMGIGMAANGISIVIASLSRDAIGRVGIERFELSHAPSQKNSPADVVGDISRRKVSA